MASGLRKDTVYHSRRREKLLPGSVSVYLAQDNVDNVTCVTGRRVFSVNPLSTVLTVGIIDALVIF